MQYSTAGNGLSQEKSPGGATEAVLALLRWNAGRESPGEESGGGLREGNTLKSETP